MSKDILSGVRVLDLTRVLSGPAAGMHLGDMGADVIKVESVDSGDETRGATPDVDGMSVYFAQLNRNKRAITLNLKSARGLAIFMELVKKADVLLENFRPGVVERLGIDYESVKKVNPRIIYGAISGFGTTGPLSQRAGYDICAQAMAGQVSVTGPEEGSGYLAGTNIGDFFAGMNMEVGVLAALYERTRTGKGQYFEIALVDALLATMPIATLKHWVDGSVPKRTGNFDPNTAPVGIFQARDGYVVVHSGSSRKLFKSFCCNVLQRPELFEDPRFETHAGRVEHRDYLISVVEEWTMQHTVDECVEICVAAGLPTAPVWNIKQIHESEFFNKDRGMFMETAMGRNGKTIDTVAQPICFAEHPREIRYHPPMFGEHNDEVYGELLGMKEAELQHLREQHIIT